MKRSTYRRLFVVAFVSLAVPVLAQDAKLIDAAKKEGGKVIVYSSMESSISDGIAAGFKKRTGLEMEYWRGSSTKVLDARSTNIGPASRSSMSPSPSPIRCI